MQLGSFILIKNSELQKISYDVTTNLTWLGFMTS